jgi:iron only hydrogenase large subunit-like protein
MEGALLKTYYADKLGIDPNDMFVVSIMPCTVKKYESGRPELAEEKSPDVDAVLTVRELVRLYKIAGIDFNDLPEDNFDNPLGESTGAAIIFGTTGGVMEAALRTAYKKLTGHNLPDLELNDLRGTGGVKEASINLKDKVIKVAVVNGIGNIDPVLDMIEKGECEYSFIEVMACPGGCVNGGGQPIHQKPEKIKKRMQALYELDSKSKRRMSYENESVMKIYDEFLDEPNSHKCHEILHTKYFDRTKVY